MKPRAIFREDVPTLPGRWRCIGDRVVILMDTNEHMPYVALLYTQIMVNGLKMHEAIHSQKISEGPNTWFRGKDHEYILISS